jgi:hypothetical protein
MTRTARQFRSRHFDPFQALRQTGTADLDLCMREVEIGEAAHFVAQARDVVLRIDVTAGRVHTYLLPRDRLAAKPAGKERMQGQSGDLRRGIPDRHVQRADRDASFAMPARSA